MELLSRLFGKKPKRTTPTGATKAISASVPLQPEGSAAKLDRYIHEFLTATERTRYGDALLALERDRSLSIEERRGALASLLKSRLPDLAGDTGAKAEKIRWLVEALEKSPGPPDRLFDVFQSVVAADNSDDLVVRAKVYVLANMWKLDDPRVQEFLCRISRDAGDESLRLRAACALGRFGGPLAVERINAMLSDPACHYHKTELESALKDAHTPRWAKQINHRSESEHLELARAFVHTYKQAERPPFDELRGALAKFAHPPQHGAWVEAGFGFKRRRAPIELSLKCWVEALWHNREPLSVAWDAIGDQLTDGAPETLALRKRLKAVNSATKNQLDALYEELEQRVGRPE